MLDDLVFMIDQYGLEKVPTLLILSTARCFGLFFGFLPINWALPRARMMKVSMGIAFGVPALFSNLGEIEVLLLDQRPIFLAFLLPKEFIIGLIIGLLSSVPFISLQYAGALTDAFRGEGDSGITDPAGGTLSTFGLLYSIIGMYVYFSTGGLEITLTILYQSYFLWPIKETLPIFEDISPQWIFVIFENIFYQAFYIALPLLIVLFFIEISVSIGARIADKFGFYDNSFLLKNIAAIIALPLVSYWIWIRSSAIGTETGSWFSFFGSF